MTFLHEATSDFELLLSVMQKLSIKVSLLKSLGLSDLIKHVLLSFIFFSPLTKSFLKNIQKFLWNESPYTMLESFFLTSQNAEILFSLQKGKFSSFA